MATLTRERLIELLRYNPTTGLWTWVARSSPASRVAIGGVAGSKNNYGYIMIKIDDKSYKAHRLAWLWMTGEWPTKDIDHRDTDKANNKWENLRVATRSNNVANSGLMITNTSGFKGVSFVPKIRKFKAQIRIDGEVIYLGIFDEPEHAHAAYRMAAIKHHGEFARFN